MEMYLFKCEVCETATLASESVSPWTCPVCSTVDSRQKLVIATSYDPANFNEGTSRKVVISLPE